MYDQKLLGCKNQNFVAITDCLFHRSIGANGRELLFYNNHHFIIIITGVIIIIIFSYSQHLKQVFSKHASSV